MAALLLGLSFKFDQALTRPAAQFFDSMNRVLYHLNTKFISFLALGMIVLSADLVFTLRSSIDLALFGQILGILIIDALLVLFALFPLLYYLLNKGKNPYRVLYNSLGSLLAAAASGNILFTLPFLFRHMKENEGVPRKLGSAALPLFAAFGKAGTAMVTTVAFISLISFYSGLGIAALQVLWVLLFAFLTSFFLPAVPGLGVYVSLSLLCRFYGNGMEEGYLLLKSITPFMVGIGVLLDTAAAAFSLSLVSSKLGMPQSVEFSDAV